jgi:ABC-type dipeptide/oligopeptide/nickel transport system permease subunit
MQKKAETESATTARSKMAEARRRGASQWAVAWRRFKRNKSGLAGLFIVVFFVFIALTSPWLAPYPPRSYQSLYELEAGEPPSWKHPFGTSFAGLDVFSEVLHGAQGDLYVGVGATLVAVIIGLVVGALAGYFRGGASDVLLMVTQVFYTIPLLPLILLFARVFMVIVAQGFGLTLILLLLGFFGWPTIAFVVRGEILRVRELDFVKASQALGASRWRVIFRHIVPNILTPVIVTATLLIAGNILTEVVISFLGFGDANTSTWGITIEEGFTYMRTNWWTPVFPGLATLFAVLGFNLLGDGLSDALNPRLRD